MIFCSKNSCTCLSVSWLLIWNIYSSLILHTYIFYITYIHLYYISMYLLYITLRSNMVIRRARWYLIFFSNKIKHTPCLPKYVYCYRLAMANLNNSDHMPVVFVRCINYDSVLTTKASYNEMVVQNYERNSIANSRSILYLCLSAPLSFAF